MPVQTPIKEKALTLADSDEDQKRHKDGKKRRKKKNLWGKESYTRLTRKRSNQKHVTNSSCKVHRQEVRTVELPLERSLGHEQSKKLTHLPQMLKTTLGSQTL